MQYKINLFKCLNFMFIIIKQTQLSMKQLQQSNNQITQIRTNEIKVRPKIQHIELYEQKSAKTEKIGDSSEIQLSSNAIKHKLPEIILKYIMQQAKQKRGDDKSNKTKNTNKVMKVAAKITQNKKLQDKYLKFKCDICQMDVPEREKQSIAGCQHYYCSSCLHQYSIFKISSFQEVQCPNQNCKKQLDEKSKLYTQLPLQTRKKYKKLKQYSQVLKRPGLKLCPNQECDGFLQVKQPQNQQHILITNPKCQKCNKIYCSQCLFEQHEGQCDPHQLTFFQVTLHYRQCSRCKQVIEKSSGCNHMTCKCGYQFCYICGKKWNSSHICNNPDGQPLNNENNCCCCNLQCECCDQCCQSVSQCLGNCCQNICNNCCEPMCNRCESFCSTQCCQNDCCRILCKILYGSMIFLFFLPCMLFLFVFLLASKLFIGIALGLFGFCFVLEEQNIQITSVRVIFGLLLLPFTIIFFIFLGLKYVFNTEGVDQLKEVLCLPCLLFQSICNE